MDSTGRIVKRLLIACICFDLLSVVQFPLPVRGCNSPRRRRSRRQSQLLDSKSKMGPADQITSHLYSFGIRGKQFQYVEGKLPEGFPFHGRFTDHDVRNLQARGAEVIVLNPNFTSAELMQARAGLQRKPAKNQIRPMRKRHLHKRSQELDARRRNETGACRIRSTGFREGRPTSKDSSCFKSNHRASYPSNHLESVGRRDLGRRQFCRRHSFRTRCCRRSSHDCDCEAWLQALGTDAYGLRWESLSCCRTRTVMSELEYSLMLLAEQL